VEKGVRNRNFFSPKKNCSGSASTFLVEKEVGRDSRECIIYRIYRIE
jgi:hypothetical protein